jgi:hypothetical protein
MSEVVLPNRQPAPMPTCQRSSVALIRDGHVTTAGGFTGRLYMKELEIRTRSTRERMSA